ncbi:Response regulator receiver domain-containing protein [Paucidesulfovibrio gracilis DSM 16080]|jgi:CheY-like chemotaxis protein|uniref:Response regulator receiver domain-containing protein n=1 Tax=Paucidesulfovibrio gracilis DSM 16080 TaxID=1121449 RepID=A0A1T4XFS9_9BACT|nr:response regulator [Paucidesulfovibrio gracilis]SKA87915.1 Response regulator receiver domain-containing protein [Paucidesulfovibrio gracilis DSM 16080]
MKRILIAEDDRISQRLAKTVVESLGYAAFVSPNGKHAYDALKAENGFDLLITDIMMPEMDGRQLIQTLRGDSELRDLPVIIMSAVVGIGDIASLLQLGASRFLAKPLVQEDLEESIARCLNLDN